MEQLELSGKRSGMLVAIEKARSKSGKLVWKCKCDCGNYTFVDPYNFSSNKTKSCGCQKKRKTIDLVGKRYGRLVVDSISEKKHGRTAWLCKCDCGKECIKTTHDLRSGSIKSCGCLKKELSSERAKTHGESKTRLYRIWADIKTRCFNPKSSNYYKYGGRGITMCAEWFEYELFKNWSLSNGYKDDLSIDRIDVNGNYEPSNCRWTDILTQANNTRRNVYLEHNGEKKTVAEWARYYGCNYSLLSNRLIKGYSKGDIFFGLDKV